MVATRFTRWLVPATALAVVIGAGSLSLNAQADGALEPRTAEQLLVDVQQAKPQPLSGVVETTANLGLPALPNASGPHGASSTDPMTALAGTNTFRVWVGDHTQQKVAWVKPRSEMSITHNGRDVWVWDSTQKTAHHVELPSHEALPEKTPHPVPSGMPSTPADAAQQVLEHLDATTAVSVDKQVSVAGRAAYELVLTPKSDATRVKAVRIAIDGQTKLPLRVQVLSKIISEPAISVGFTSVTFTAPPASVFEFTPAEGVEVTTTTVPTASPDEVKKAIEQAKAKHEGATAPKLVEGKPTVTGKGWDAIATGRTDAMKDLASKAPAGENAEAAQSPLDLLPVRTGEWGTARVLDGTLVSLVVTDDGRFAIGAVSPDALLKALPTK